MPNPVVILLAMAAAPLVAAAILGSFALWKRRVAPGLSQPSPWLHGLVGMGWPLAVGAGFWVGAAALGLWPHGLPGTDKDRLLLVVVPLVTFVEIGLVVIRPTAAWQWLIRLVVAGSLAPILLFGSVYLAAATSASTDTWTTSQRIVILGGLAAGFVGQWFLVVALENRGRGTTVWAALAVTSLGAGVATMLSGYMSAGQMALPLAATLGVAAIASGMTGQQPGKDRTVGGGLVVGLACLGSVLVMGRFFGALSTMHALTLAVAPLVCWFAELPWFDGRPRWQRVAVAIALVLVPIVFVVWGAQASFAAKSASPYGAFPS